MNMHKIVQKIDAIKFCENGEMISLSNLKKEISKIEKQHNIRYNSKEATMIWYMAANKYKLVFDFVTVQIAAGII